jgi:hypothetical protein
MQMENMMRHMSAQGGALKQFANFMEHANTRNFEALEHTLKAFNTTTYEDFEEVAFIALSMFLAARSGETTEETARLADNIGFGAKQAIEHLFAHAPIPDIDLVAEFLCRIADNERKERNPLAIMRELVAEKSDPTKVEPTASIDKLADSLKAAEPAAQDPDPDNLDENSPALHPLEWMRLKYEKSKKEDWGSIHFTMNIYRDGYTDLGVDLDEDDFKAIIAGWKMQQVEDEEPAPNPEAEPLVDDMVATFEKLSGVLARRKEVPAQE